MRRLARAHRRLLLLMSGRAYPESDPSPGSRLGWRVNPEQMSRAQGYCLSTRPTRLGVAPAPNHALSVSMSLSSCLLPGSPFGLGGHAVGAPQASTPTHTPQPPPRPPAAPAPPSRPHAPCGGEARAKLLRLPSGDHDDVDDEDVDDDDVDDEDVDYDDVDDDDVDYDDVDDDDVDDDDVDEDDVDNDDVDDDDVDDDD
eukprot:1622474-Rhodomonas_salina.1